MQSLILGVYIKDIFPKDMQQTDLSKDLAKDMS